MRKKLPARVVLAIFTTVTIVVWVGYGVYQELRTEHSAQVPKEILEPINPQLDNDTLAKISEKLYFERGSTVAFSSQSAIINLEPQISATPTETPVGQETEAENEELLFPEESATKSAEIVQ